MKPELGLRAPDTAPGPTWRPPPLSPALRGRYGVNERAISLLPKHRRLGPARPLLPPLPVIRLVVRNMDSIHCPPYHTRSTKLNLISSEAAEHCFALNQSDLWNLCDSGTNWISHMSQPITLKLTKEKFGFSDRTARARPLATLANVPLSPQLHQVINAVWQPKDITGCLILVPWT